MTRSLALLLVLLTAASPAHKHKPRLPVPPVPPLTAPTDMAAPIPDPDLRPPTLHSPGGPTIGPDFFPMNYHDESKGFTPGSQMFAKPERNPEFAPGFLLQVPFK